MMMIVELVAPEGYTFDPSAPEKKSSGISNLFKSKKEPTKEPAVEDVSTLKSDEKPGDSGEADKAGDAQVVDVKAETATAETADKQASDKKPDAAAGDAASDDTEPQKKPENSKKSD